ncbi:MULTISPECIES: adenylyl-sulfate kinase [Luteimonas]|uniref:adenylyl-sulfate kinase n=1 Tax=Luteimonas TaxID=83614 RepID=UPI000C7B7FEB|nr:MULTISPECIES: adenylyl-sulfate kinase [Luteimonas]
MAIPREQDPVVRVVACGSVDDGKSTLIGRLLYDAGRVPDDERAALAGASVRHGTRGEALDYALLLDGLDAEREQGITIDVAWRHLETSRRRFLIADCPGHVQYTRNMATGASVAHVALVLVDATKGLLSQTYRHTAIAALLGVQHVVLVVNKMDRVGYRQDVFDVIVGQYRTHAARLGIGHIDNVPVAAALGENVTESSAQMPWYQGRCVLDTLESLAIHNLPAMSATLPVQLVLRDGDGRRWLAGNLHGAGLATGARVHVAPSGIETTIAALRDAGGEVRTVEERRAAVAIRLADDVDVGRGAVVTTGGGRLQVSDQLVADVLWFDDAALVPGRRYQLKLATQSTGVRVVELKHRFDPESLQPLAARTLDINDIGRVSFALDTPVVFAPYESDRVLGGFILVDTVSFATVAAGLVRHGLRRADNLQWQALDVDATLRARQKAQRPLCVWLTGLSGAGKSTIANLAERALVARGFHTYLLDGDNVRHGLNRDLGFTDADRMENLRRVAEVARLMTDAGLITLVSVISPFEAEREAARRLFATGDFIEVFIDTPLAEAERRDVKGLYAKARRGELPNFTGIDSPYEAPASPELRLDTTSASPETLADALVAAVIAAQSGPGVPVSAHPGTG